MRKGVPTRNASGKQRYKPLKHFSPLPLVPILFFLFSGILKSHFENLNTLGIRDELILNF